MLSIECVKHSVIRRLFLQVEATDNDEGENAVVTYSIYHVSNNGRLKFTIDPISGLIETTGKLNAGDQYSITVQVSVAGGLPLQSQADGGLPPRRSYSTPSFK